MPQVDLNKLRQTVLSNRDTGEVRPLDPSRQVHVDRLGNIVVDDPRGTGQPLSEVHQSTFAMGRMNPVVRVLDSVVRSIEEQIAAHPPERGGALLGPRDCAVITHFLHDDEAETTATTYRPSRTLNEQVKDLERGTSLELKGLIHSHPGGLDHPSAQDTRELGVGLHLNGHMGSYLALIVTSGPPAEVHCHEIALPSGKLSCFKAYRGPKRTASVVPSAVEVIPVLEHLERLSHEYEGQAPEEFLTDVGAGPMPAGRIQLDGIEVLVIASALFPAVPPIVLVTPEGGETEQLPPSLGPSQSPGRPTPLRDRPVSRQAGPVSASLWPGGRAGRNDRSRQGKARALAGALHRAGSRRGGGGRQRGPFRAKLWPRVTRAPVADRTGGRDRVGRLVCRGATRSQRGRQDGASRPRCGGGREPLSHVLRNGRRRPAESRSAGPETAADQPGARHGTSVPSCPGRSSRRISTRWSRRQTSWSRLPTTRMPSAR